MVNFEEMFDMIDVTFAFIGLSDIYKTNVLKTMDFRRIFYIIGLLNLVPLVVGEIIFFIVQMINEEDREQFFFMITDMMPCTIESIYSIVKTLAVVWHRKLICDLVEELRQMWPERLDEDVKKIVSQSMLPTKQYSLVYTIVTNVLSCVYNFIPLVIMCFNFFTNGDRVLLLPYYIWYPYDWKSSRSSYTATYISQMYAGIFTTAAVSGVDCMYCLLVAHLCMHFKLLRRNIINFKFDADSDVKDIVVYHNTIMRACKDVEKIFSQSILVNLVASSVIICLSIFSITICPPVRIINYLLFLSSSLLQILMMSWYGTNLIEESTGVALAAYESQWIGTGPYHCRAIMMMQIRAAKPVVISAMGYFDISLHTFSSILSASWSYFALLKTMYQKRKED